MPTTTNFTDWLEQVDPNHHEIWALYEAVTSEESQGPFEVSKSGDKLFVKYPNADLVMITERAQKVFLDTLEKKYCGDMDIESWCELKFSLEREARKDD